MEAVRVEMGIVSRLLYKFVVLRVFPRSVVRVVVGILGSLYLEL